MTHGSCLPPDGNYGDVVVLAPGLGRLGDLLRRLRRDLPRAVEAEELALGVLRFHDTVGEHRQAGTGLEREGGLEVVGIGIEAEGEAGIDKVSTRASAPSR